MENNITDATMRFTPRDEEQAQEINQVLREVCLALQEKGYDPLDQIVGYLLSGDPAYITSHRNARVLIRRIDRDQILEELVRFYLGREGS
ncbi:MAG: IreB family regulatory phosphoprotein [Firmicutes bacterium]|nr:IreB family regulatory phosphoprotein [Bacillota bacterium]